MPIFFAILHLPLGHLLSSRVVFSSGDEQTEHQTIRTTVTKDGKKYVKVVKVTKVVSNNTEVTGGEGT